MQGPLIPSEAPALRRTLAVSILFHALALAVALALFKPQPLTAEPDIVDIEVAPEAPPAEALPAEVARALDRAAQQEDDQTEQASTTPHDQRPEEGSEIADAGVDAPVDAAVDARADAAVDARPDARVDAAVDARPDAPVGARPDASAPVVAENDAGAGDDANAVAATTADAGVTDATKDAIAVAATTPDATDDATAVATTTVDAGATDATAVAAASDATIADAIDDAITAATTSPPSDASAPDARAVATTATPGNSGGAPSMTPDNPAAGSGEASMAPGAGGGSAVAGMTDEPAVMGAPTTAGTAANLLTYFPQGHVVTALIRFDRLRGTEWAAQTERLLHPMPDYQFLFGGADARITDKLETLIISTPSPRDIAATILVGRTKLARAGLRDLLSAAAPVTWSAAKGGLLGVRTRAYRGDKRVFLSPFRGWFLLAQPRDLAGLTAPAAGTIDAVEATVKLPPWLAGIRKIETESGDDARGPALVLTLQVGGKRVDLKDNDFGLGIKSLPTPDRVSLAMELVTQGWLVRGNMRFARDNDAAEFVTAAESVRDRVGDSTAIQMVIGKPLARVIKNLSFARTGGRVSYATSISIADARAILAATAQQLDGYFGP